MKRIIWPLLVALLLVSCEPPAAPVTNIHVIYNGNQNTSGNPPIDSKSYMPGDMATLLENSNLQKTDSAFSGWNTNANGTGTSFQAGASVSLGSSDFVLFAKWTQLDQVAAPTFSPDSSDQYLKFTQDTEVHIASTTQDALIYFTTDGSTPTINSQQYQNPILVSDGNEFFNIRAIAIKSGMRASTVSKSTTYWVDYPTLPAPSFSITGVDFDPDQHVVLACSVLGADIYFTLDGTSPTASSTKYSGPIYAAQAGQLLNVRAIAIKDQYKNSPVASEYVVRYVVTGSTDLVDVTLSNASGGTEQYSDQSVPVTFNYTAFPDSFLYISAQNQRSSGSVNTFIILNGSIFKSSTSSGAYVIATSSGSK